MSKPDNDESKRRPDELGGANTPQHLVGDYGEDRQEQRRGGLPTGSGTSAENDVADPHPSNEEHYDKKARPGGANPPDRTIEPNDAVHDGKGGKRPPPRPGAPG